MSRLTRSAGDDANKIADKNVPNSTIEDVRAYSDNVWPSASYRITVDSGLEPAYRVSRSGVLRPRRW